MSLCWSFIRIWQSASKIQFYVCSMVAWLICQYEHNGKHIQRCVVGSCPQCTSGRCKKIMREVKGRPKQACLFISSIVNFSRNLFPQECNGQTFLKGAMLWAVTQLHYHQLINSGELHIYILSYEQDTNFSECVYSVLLRHLGCGVCLYLSSSERHYRVSSLWWNIQARTKLQFELLVNVEASFGRHKAITRVL